MTTEFSFVLKPSEHGVGVFAVHDIKSGEHLRLFGNDNQGERRSKDDVPEFFRDFCLDRGDSMFCPTDFGRMEVGWYANHSRTPNAYHVTYAYFALREIKAGEEITIDYNTLGEPEEGKANYYKSED